ncbi:MAG: SDR family oxidoreductase [Coriobacteriales bacterium]|jgi:gluconate 5-dehydrogenase|nr:SDR family oxidoreductase [Coriobacteriales bacterium]
MFDLTGRVAVVTGASSGLGRQMARALARQGASLALIARRENKLQEVQAEIEALGAKCMYVPTDITDTDAVAAAAAKIEAEYGKVDIMINDAGAGATDPIEETTDETWNKDISVDLTGQFKMIREFGKIMIKNHYGRIINIASMYGLVGNTALPSGAYHAAKGAMVNFTRAVAAEWAKYGINCNSICPGYFGTELTKATLDTADFQAYMKQTVPLGRYGEEGELDAAAVFLASDEASYVTGAILPVDGGYTCV